MTDQPPETIPVLDHGFIRLVDSMITFSNKRLRFRRDALEKKISLLTDLQTSGSIAASCKKLGISRYSVIGWRKTDEAFDSYVHDVLAVWRGSLGVRKCPHCFLIKDISEFTARSDRKGQQKSTCKPCNRVQGKNSYSRNKRTSFFKHKANKTRSRSRNLGMYCNITAQYLESIWTGICPVFGTTLDPLTDRGMEDATELDRLRPHLGYVIGNVVFMSRRANRIKNNVRLDEMKLLVQWMESVGLGEEKCAA